MKNVEEMRDELNAAFNDLKNDNADLGLAKAKVAICNTMLKSSKLQMEHNKLIGSKAKVKFLMGKNQNHKD